MRITIITLIGLAALVLAPACVLPTYEEVDTLDNSSLGDEGQPAGLSEEGACGLSHMLETACDKCIRENCCELAEECGEGTACGEDLLEPITPIADFSTDFDPLLGCMQSDCNVECEVNWGCVDDYDWPIPDEDYSFDVKVVDYAAEPEKPLADVAVQACKGVDAACESGLVDSATTGEDGTVNMTVPPDFDGFFTFSGGGYLDTTVQWSEPVHRLIDWSHYELLESSLSALALITGVHESPEQEFDENTGHFIFRMQNCLPLRYLGSETYPQAEAPDVTIEFEPNEGASKVFYTTEVGGVSVTLDATTRDGLGGAFNVPARNVSARAIEKQTGRVVAESLVHVRPGTIGYIYFVPKSR